MEEDPLLDRATRLLQFLARSAAVRAGATPSEAETVLRCDGVPAHPAIRRVGRELTDGVTLLAVDRPDIPAVPDLPDDLRAWVSGDVARPGSTLRLRSRITVGEGRRRSTRHLTDHPDVRASFTTWHDEWRAWATAERTGTAPRALLGRLIDLQARVRDTPDLELALAVGLFTWQRATTTHRTHLLTAPVTLDITEESAVVRLDPGADVSIEVDGTLPVDPAVARTAASEARAVGSLLDAAALARPATTLLDALPAAAPYDPSLAFPEPSGRPVITWSPALVLRPRRCSREVVRGRVAAEVARSRRVPAGLRPLLTGAADPDDVHPPTDDVGRHGAVTSLLTDLLAQGRRVLVTAPDAAPLRRARENLPVELRPLVMGAGLGHRDATDLADSLSALTRRILGRDPEATAATISEAEAAIHRLAERRARLIDAAARDRDAENTVHTHGGRTGTLADLADRHARERGRHDWLGRIVVPGPDDPLPVGTDVLTRWWELSRDPDAQALREQASRRHLDPATHPTPAEFRRLLADRSAARARAREQAAAVPQGRPVWEHLDEPDLASLRSTLTKTRDVVREVRDLPVSWVHGALADLHAGRGEVWHRRRLRVNELLTLAGERIESVGAGREVSVRGDPAALTGLAVHLWRYLIDQGPIPVDDRGLPRLGVDPSPELVAALPVFANVRVDGRPPTRLEDVETLLWHVESHRVLDDLDDTWPQDTVIPCEQTAAQRRDWHVAQFQHLSGLLDLAADMSATAASCARLGLELPDWTTPGAPLAYDALIAAAEAQSDAVAAGLPLADLAVRLRTACDHPDIGDTDLDLRDAATRLDPEAYEVAWHRLDDLRHRRGALGEFDRLDAEVRARAPRLAAAVDASRDDPAWAERLAGFAAAWEWCRTGTWLAETMPPSAEETAERLARVDDDIDEHVAELAALRAWGHASTPERLDPRLRVDLTLYAHLARRVALGTATPRHRAELARVTTRCTSAVPIRLVPLDRLAGHLDPGHDVVDGVDVVVVLAAERLGMDTAWLRALAPRIVLFADDAEEGDVDHDGDSADGGAGADGDTDTDIDGSARPEESGVTTRVRRLAERYLHDVPFREHWTDPSMSLLRESRRRGATDPPPTPTDENPSTR